MNPSLDSTTSHLKLLIEAEANINYTTSNVGAANINEPTFNQDFLLTLSGSNFGALPVSISLNPNDSDYITSILGSSPNNVTGSKTGPINLLFVFVSIYK